MADNRAIQAVGEAVANLLRGSHDPADFGTVLDFRVITSGDFGTNQIVSGASLFLYRVIQNGSHRIPAGRLNAQGQRLQTRLPVDLHYLVTFWGADASMQHAIAGWAMRVLEDTPLLTSGVLNAAVPGSFRSDEVVDFSLSELSNEDLLRIWEVLGLNQYQLSVPYVARNVQIESTQRLRDGGGEPVQQRDQDAGVFRATEAFTG